MKRIQSFIACALLFSYCMATANAAARFARVATRAAQAAVAQPRSPQKAHTKASLAQLAAAAYARFPENREQLDRACEHFHATPGFLVVVDLIVRHRNPASALGYWYEVQKALALHREHSTDRNQSVVAAFDEIIAAPDGSKQREFDIVAVLDGQPVWVECKAIQWKCYCPRETGAQFCDQSDIAGAHEVDYQVSSKRDIPPGWLNFFERYGIKTNVDSCDYEKH